ncbi:MAG: methyltransferase domain-containing protein [Planctomycetota bacterium]
MSAASPWLERLVCPKCRGHFERRTALLHCPSCQTDYPSVAGKPWLRLSAPVVAESQYLGGWRGRLRNSRWYPLLFRLFSPVLVTGPDVARRYAPLADAGGLVVDLGAGNDRRHPRFLNIDILPYPNVDLVCDGEALPLADASVDALFNIAVLEHVAAPIRAIEEARRVLKPHAKLLIVVPFLQPFHAAPADFRRWTLPGLRLELELAGFCVDEGGVYCGPCSTCAWLCAESLAFVLSCGKPAWQSRLTLPLQALCSIFKWPDLFFARWRGAQSLASVVYVEAHKPGNADAGGA